MKYLGVDYGSKRLGIAVSDQEGRIAVPREVIRMDGGEELIFNRLKSLASEENIRKIIVGLPLTFAGADSGQTRETRIFAERLQKKTSLPIEFENEILTTKIAQAGSNKKTVDASAAALILQSHLDKLNSGR